MSNPGEALNQSRGESARAPRAKPERRPCKRPRPVRGTRSKRPGVHRNSAGRAANARDERGAPKRPSSESVRLGQRRWV